MSHTRLSPPFAIPRLSRSGLLRYSCAYFLGALALMFVSAPFMERIRGGDLIEAGLMTVVLTSAVVAVGARRRTLVTAIVLLTPTLIAKWLSHARPDLVAQEVYLGLAMVFVAFVIVQLLRYIIRAPRVDSEVVCAGIASYLMIGLLWALGYWLLGRLEPHAFLFTYAPEADREMKGFITLYFSFVTLTTCGYGDIIPIAAPARMLAAAESVVGVLYVGVLIARLVSLYTTAAAPRMNNHSD